MFTADPHFLTVTATESAPQVPGTARCDIFMAPPWQVKDMDSASVIEEPGITGDATGAHAPYSMEQSAEMSVSAVAGSVGRCLAEQPAASGNTASKARIFMFISN